MTSSIYNRVSATAELPQTQNIRSARKLVATVIENRLNKDGTLIRVVFNQALPLMKGHLKDLPVSLNRNLSSSDGRKMTVRGTHNNNLTAVWHAQDGYRKTPPDVQRGERVYVWQVGDTDNWRWEEMNDDATSMRHVETVVQSVNADKKENKDSKEFGPHNQYYIENSSELKHFTISTSKANGEFAAYVFQINAKDGCVVIQDDIGNAIELNSKKKTIWFRNICDTEVRLQENNIYVHCHENYQEKIGQNQISQIGANRKVTIGGSCTVDIKGSANIKVGGSTKLECGNTEITGNVKIGGNVNIGGNLNVKGNISGGGGGSFSGSLSVSGSVSLHGGTSAGLIHGSWKC